MSVTKICVVMQVPKGQAFTPLNTTVLEST